MKTLPLCLPHAALLCTALFVSACDVSVGDGGLSFGIARGKASDEWTRTYTVSPGGRLEIVNINGSIDVSPSSGSQIEIRALREVRAGDDDVAREELGKLPMLEEVAPDRVSVRARIDRERRSGFGRGQAVIIEYKIRIPNGLSVSLKTENGGVRLENVQGQLVAGTVNGGVTARSLSGSLEAATVNGGIQIDLASVTGNVSATTVNGGVRVELPTDVKADIEGSAVNGGVSVDDRFAFTGDRPDAPHFPGVPKLVSGKINGGGHKISVHTVNGGVRVTARGAPRGET